MKQLAHRILGSIGSHVPDRAWNVVLKTLLQNDVLIDRHGARYLSELAARLNISRVSATGEYGTFSSAPNDETILKEYAKNGQWAATTNLALINFFRQGRGTYLDVGANIGLTVVPLASKTDVKCFAFEPEPVNFRNLEINIAENCAGKDITVFQLALFDRDSSISFEMSPNNLGDHRVRMKDAGAGFQNETARRVVNVPCVRLDSLNLDISTPLFVKIDTQGAEPFVIAGGRQTLAKADAVLMEWSPYLIKRMGGDHAAALDFLRTNFAFGAIHHDPEAAHNDSFFQPIDVFCHILAESITGWPVTKYVDVIVKR
jgi:FkbM family methyltransferase